jgi:hypothetical protein
MNKCSNLWQVHWSLLIDMHVSYTQWNCSAVSRWSRKHRPVHCTEVTEVWTWNHLELQTNVQFCKWLGKSLYDTMADEVKILFVNCHIILSTYLKMCLPTHHHGRTVMGFASPALCASLAPQKHRDTSPLLDCSIDCWSPWTSNNPQETSKRTVPTKICCAVLE